MIYTIKALYISQSKQECIIIKRKSTIIYMPEGFPGSQTFENKDLKAVVTAAEISSYGTVYIDRKLKGRCGDKV